MLWIFNDNNYYTLIPRCIYNMQSRLLEAERAYVVGQVSGHYYRAWLAAPLFVLTAGPAAAQAFRMPPIVVQTPQIQQYNLNLNDTLKITPSLETTLKPIEAPQVRIAEPARAQPAVPAAGTSQGQPVHIPTGWDYLQDALRDLNNGYYSSAESGFRRAIDAGLSFEGMHNAYLGLAVATYNQKNYNGTLAAAEKLSVYNSREAEQYSVAAYTAKWQSAYQDKRYDDAIEALIGLKNFKYDDAINTLLGLAAELTVKQEYGPALSAYEATDNNPERYRGIIRIEVARGNYEKALAATWQLGGVEGARTRAWIYESIGALPLAVKEVSSYRSDTQVQRYLADKELTGQDRFEERQLFSDWCYYEPARRMGEEQLLFYLFRKSGNGVQPWPSARLTRRPAPRDWSARLLWKSLKNRSWSDTAAAQEYVLYINGPQGSDIAAIWDRQPANDIIERTSEFALGVYTRMHDAERERHEGQADRAFDTYRDIVEKSEAVLDGIPHFSALMQWLSTSAESDRPEEITKKIRNEFEETYPYEAKLAWASILQQAAADRGEEAVKNARSEAQAVLQEAMDEWPRRYPAVNAMAELIWQQVESTHGGEKVEALKTLDGILKRLDGLQPALATDFYVRLHYLLGSYALTAQALNRLAPDQETAETRATRDFLARLNEDQFQSIADMEKGQLYFEVYQSLNDASPVDTFAHHLVEIAVLDGSGRHIETFALVRQALLPGQPPLYLLDRITADGRETLAQYDKKIPTARELVQALIGAGDAGTAATDEFVLQLLSSRSEEKARDAWVKINKQHGEQLGGLSYGIKRIDLGDKGIWFRLQVGPLDNRQAAEQLCKRLKQGDVEMNCLVSRGSLL